MIKQLLLFIFLSSCSTLSSSKDKLVIYLHGMGKSPLLHEKDNIEAMARAARDYDYKFIAIEAKGNCYYLNPPRLDFKCWDNKRIEGELRSILQKQHDKDLVLIGFSNGAYFLGGALERNLLKNISKVGIISGGSAWMKEYPEIDPSPQIYIENATGDKWNKKWVKDLHNRLSKKINPDKLRYREIEREHQQSPGEAYAFVSWVLGSSL